MSGSDKATNPKDAIAGTRIPLWLLSPVAKAAWALAQYAGPTKYGAWNWRVAGVRASVYASAAGRHIDAYLSGETHDPVDGTHHLGNVMACCAIVLDAAAAGKLIDDRPPEVSLRPAYAEGETLMAKLQAQYADKAPKHWTIADTASAPVPVESPDTRVRELSDLVRDIVSNMNDGDPLPSHKARRDWHERAEKLGCLGTPAEAPDDLEYLILRELASSAAAMSAPSIASAIDAEVHHVVYALNKLEKGHKTERVWLGKIFGHKLLRPAGAEPVPPDPAPDSEECPSSYDPDSDRYCGAV
jgi:hypothetical protein